MAPFNNEILQKFPLQSISDVVNLFKSYLKSNSEPDLAMLSIITGMVENILTSKNISDAPVTNQPSQQKQQKLQQSQNRQTSNAANTNQTTITQNNFPIIHIENVRNLYDKFKQIIVKSVESKQKTKLQYASREIIKKVSDVIWNSLTRNSHKDRAHLQNLYSYLVDNKLDCFGVALAVVAGCQILGYNDVHLAISEDHAWVVFGKTQNDTVEITWHGKGAEDKRGQPVTAGYQSHSWLYLAGNPVICDRYMEIGAIVSSINPSLSMTSECTEVAELQQRLLWLLYTLQHLEKYPMALGCLGELEEVSPTTINIANSTINTNNTNIPTTIPTTASTESLADATTITTTSSSSTTTTDNKSLSNKDNIVKRPSAEELYTESIISAKKYYKNHHVYPYTYLGGFYYRQHRYKDAFSAWANAGDVIRLYNYSRDDEEIYKEFLDIANETIPHVMKIESSGHSGKSIVRDPHCFADLLRFYDGICQWEEGSQTPILHIGWAKKLVTTISRFDCDIRSQVIINCGNPENTNVIGTRTATTTNENNNITKLDIIGKSNETKVLSTLEALTAACAEKILNPNFLLQGGGELFETDEKYQEKKCDIKFKNDGLDKNNDNAILNNNINKVITNNDNNNNTNNKVIVNNDNNNNTNNNDTNNNDTNNNDNNTNNNVNNNFNNNNNNDNKFNDDDDNVFIPKRPILTLYSEKMKGIKDLLLSEKLNTHAISLQMTAQSQVQVGGKKSRNSSSSSSITIGNVSSGIGNNSGGGGIGTVNYSISKRLRRE